MTNLSPNAFFNVFPLKKSLLFSKTDVMTLYNEIWQAFNHSSMAWNSLNTNSAPMDIVFSGCVVLPTEDILIVGSEFEDQSSAALFNVESGTWTTLGSTTHPRNGTSLVTLGKRVFAIDGHAGNIVEEFNYNTNSWSSVPISLMTWRNGHQAALAVPAEKFMNLSGGCTGVR